MKHVYNTTLKKATRKVEYLEQAFELTNDIKPNAGEETPHKKILRRKLESPTHDSCRERNKLKRRLVISEQAKKVIWINNLQNSWL